MFEVETPENPQSREIGYFIKMDLCPSNIIQSFINWTFRYYPEEDEDRQALGRAIYQLESVLHQKCIELRKRKELELTLLQQPIRNWNGETIENLGTLRLMTQVTTHLTPRLSNETKELHLVWIFFLQDILQPELFTTSLKSQIKTLDLIFDFSFDHKCESFLFITSS